MMFVSNLGSLEMDERHCCRARGRLVQTTRCFSIWLLVLTTTGCSTVSYLTAGPVGRQAMLSERSEKFHRALSFASPAEALEYVAPEQRVEFLTRQRSAMREQTIVSVDVKDIDFNDDSKEATVTVSTRYFQSPTYHVEAREDRERWVYNGFDGGWFYDGVSVSEAKGRTALESHFGR